ncbi:nucleoside triphosphate pyrophosphohydrolase [Mycolicibacterium fortuitum]|uniref:Nucleoside triphosphate pyrophosphohydrolase n=1 Tax=Mycolicibacterium fortuitum subsp. fortuitum DSM 46621 = ATCC 6841 = JCM 6387 TaxID=1214102 RepID=K0UNP1_MYCFO|nr:nucleoside triphosphate pyrophosphohydrolase [Mycolicibacterium fortuitum]AIY48081.1 Nucleoside triphosphate pyrophosphohydrolase MazG [Mycobacterium sp. VKM Ac-1817D]CRL73936.1 nucleoside triphosphate pyrophosphohydrolase [Mycolicibacter nonchromogenicus]AMD55659.1 nucleoside triphosphate hydrolase [Mycolicibacterium fortuitum subsp. fortuitum DSM 46621 = ATCC 6841 = JCM 6387]EJZ08406.1 nucleoside triphosphate pyrophosphohydrolase [Mycolicibacterium fortuitum subsp. fortuitum DSM 46621 = AT
MTVVLVDPRRPSLVPVEAIEFLTGDVQYTEEMPVKVPWSLPSARPAYDGEDAPVLLSSDPEHPAVKARLAAGDRLIAAPQAKAGERIVDAVAMMDKLRTDGPWESEQTHDSLRRYLLEETYELFDAVRGGNADELREELGDVLLQVLFHARIAEDAPVHPFNIDDVADSLVRKLGNRVPAVLAGESISLDEQLAQWEERKAQEQKVKARGSSMDDVPTGQPALALTQKVLARVAQAGLPADLVPATLTSVAVSADVDAENDLRSAVLEFMDTVRLVESDVAAGRRGEDVPEELDVTPLGSITEEEWRTYWPGAVAEPLVVDDFDDEDDAGDSADDAADDPADDDSVAEVAPDEAAPDVDDEPVAAEPDAETDEPG